MFEFLFKYPRSIFSKGQFVLLGAWPKWILVLAVLAAAAGLGLLIRSRPAAGRSRRDALAGGRHLAASVLAGRSAAGAAVAAGDHGRRAEAAAKHHRRAGGRFAQHGHLRGRRHPPGPGRQGAAGRRARRARRRSFRRVSTASTVTRPASRASTNCSLALRPRASATASSSWRPRPPTCPSARWCCSATAPTIPAASTWTPSPRCATATFPFTPWASARADPRTTWRWTMSRVAPRALADSRLAATVSFHQRGYAGQQVDAHGARRREGPRLARDHFRRATATSRPKRSAVQRRRRRRQDARSSRSIRCPARRTAPTTP